MTTFKCTDYRFSLGFYLMVLCTLLLWPVNGMALPQCPLDASAICADPTIALEDCDGDGFTNGQECDGFTTAGGEPIASGELDPTTADLFYLVSDLSFNDLAATDSYGNSSLLFAALASDPDALTFYSSGDLRVRTHRITSDYCGSDRLIANGVRAARIVESLSLTAEGTYLGSTEQSVPSDSGVFSTIYTQKIKNNVDENCPPGTSCAIKGTSINNSNGSDNTPITNRWILQVVSHEVGHGSDLAPTSAKSYYHYSRSGTIMDPSASFRRGVYTIPTVFDPVKDPVALKLTRP